MTPPQALGFARGAARCRQLRPTASHACERMEQRGVTPRDVVHAVLTSTTVVPDPNRQGRFVLLGGTDVTGHPLSVVIAIEGNVVLVVTIIGK